MQSRLGATTRSLGLAVTLAFSLSGPAWASTTPQVDDNLGAKARFAVPLSCAAVALIRGTEYPETIRIYDEGHEARRAAEANCALLGLTWRHRQQFARYVATEAFTALYDRAPTEDELRDERSRWVHTLMGYPQPLRDAVETNCEPLFEAAEQRGPGAGGAPGDSAMLTLR
jgi:hypothetical protein